MPRLDVKTARLRRIRGVAAPVGQAAVLQDLQELVRMRGWAFDLVEQHHRERFSRTALVNSPPA
jgi:hypothetical protein